MSEVEQALARADDDAQRRGPYEPYGRSSLRRRDAVVLATELRAARAALREACLHQGLPEDAPAERVGQHFRRNREMREGFDALAAAPGERL